MYMRGCMHACEKRPCIPVRRGRAARESGGVVVCTCVAVGGVCLTKGGQGPVRVVHGAMVGGREVQ